MKLYGIAGCDTVKKARAFLEQRGIAYQFHDFRKDGVDEKLISAWLQQAGWQKLLKKTGPTWSRLPDEAKAAVMDDASVLGLMLDKPNVIRRPVLEQDGKLLAAGFNQTEYENLFK